MEKSGKKEIICPMLSSPLHHPSQNHLLAALPATELDNLIPHLELIHVSPGDILCEAGDQLPYAYFPASAIISLHYILENGDSSEIANVGREGMLGVSLLMGGETTSSRATVQIPGFAYRLKAPFLLQGLNRGGLLQWILLRYSQALITQIAQIGVCNRYHTIEQQLCRWFLLTLDRLDSSKLSMTQELIANALGVSRESVAGVAGKLQRKEIIRYHRGHITILNRTRLETGACECYETIKKEFDQALEDMRKPELHQGNRSPKKILPLL
jgi:CRP-like cAMP-binding protein